MAQVFGCFQSPEMSLPVNKNLNTKDPLISEQSVDSDDSGCGNEHVSNGRDLLSYYSFHVRAIGNLINHHEDIERKLKDSEQERNALANRLHSTEVTLDQTKEKLENSEHKLHNTTKELKETQQALDGSKKALDATRHQLDKTTDKLKSTETKLDQTTDTLNKTKLELKSKDELLTKTNSDLERIKSEFDQLDSDHKDLKRSSDRTDVANEKLIKEKEASDERANSLQVKFNKAEKDLAILTNENNDLLAKRSSPFLHRRDRVRNGIYIDEVIYGGKVIDDKTIINKLLDRAANGKEFTITNDFMGGDPWRGETKSFTAVYAVGGMGPFKYINQKENQKAKFCK